MALNTQTDKFTKCTILLYLLAQGVKIKWAWQLAMVSKYEFNCVFFSWQLHSQARFLHRKHCYKNFHLIKKYLSYTWWKGSYVYSSDMLMNGSILVLLRLLYYTVSSIKVWQFTIHALRQRHSHLIFQYSIICNAHWAP